MPAATNVLAYLYWPLALALMAWAQGWLMPAIRRTPPGPEAKRQDIALHIILGAAYALPVFLLLSLGLNGKVVAAHASAMVLARLLLFDPVLNLAAGDALFAVARTAASDRAMQWLALRLSWPATRVRLVLWLVCLLLAGLLLAASY